MTPASDQLGDLGITVDVGEAPAHLAVRHHISTGLIKPEIGEAP
jgi:hypothetical protein